MTPIRINNIELRKAKSLYGEEYLEIVKWYPNSYYGNESKFLYNKEGGYYIPKDYPFCHISPSCFKNPESCFTIALLRERDSEESYIETVGMRTARLTEEEFLDYFQILKHIESDIEAELEIKDGI